MRKHTPIFTYHVTAPNNTVQSDTARFRIVAATVAAAIDAVNLCNVVMAGVDLCCSETAPGQIAKTLGALDFIDDRECEMECASFYTGEFRGNYTVRKDLVNRLSTDQLN